MISRRSFLATASAAASVAANDRIRIGVIGAGGRGVYNIREIERCRDLNLTISAVCDVYRPNLEAGAAQVEKIFGVKPKTTPDYREMLTWNDVDAVVICAPDFAHSIMLKAIVEARKDAYVEKPFGTEFSEAKAAYLAVKNSKQVVQVGTQRRSDGMFMAAAKFLQSGALGQVTRVDMAVNFQEPRWRRDPGSVAPADLNWELFTLGKIKKPFDPRLWKQWQLFDETTNGIPGLWMSHFIDLVPWYLGDPYPSTAAANGGVYLWKDGRETSDVFQTLLDYPKGFLVSFAMSLTNSAGNRNLWFGTRGTLDLDKFTASGDGSRQKDRIQSEVKLAPETTNSHMHNFIECIRSRQAPRADVQAGFSHAVAGIMSATALSTGRRVRFDREKLEIV